MSELLQDPEIRVRQGAIESFIELISFFDAEDVKSEFVPALQSHLQKDHDENCNVRTSRCFGKLIFSLQDYELEPSVHAAFVEYFKKMVASSELEIRENAAFNLPCMYYMYSYNETIDFVDVYMTFSKDEAPSVRRITAKGLHETVSMMSRTSGDAQPIKEAFFNFLMDDNLEVQRAVLERVGEIMQNFFSKEGEFTEDDREEFFEEMVEWFEHLEELFSKKKAQTWQLFADIIKQYTE